jgi:hypothetical protein
LNVLVKILLVVLDRHHVIPTRVRNGFTGIHVSEHRVARHDFTRQGKHPQQLQRGLVFVGRLGHLQLPNHGFIARGEGRDKMNAWNLTIDAAAGRLAVQSQVLSRTSASSREPDQQRVLNSACVQAAEQLR